MTIEYIILLSAIQGMTEFLPVSSSAHLALLPTLAAVADQGRFTDVAAHVGSLLAVMWHYRARVASLLMFEDLKLMWRLVLSFLPVVALGLFINPPRSVTIIAVNLIVFGIILWLADKYGKAKSEVTPLTALGAGFAQVVALIPGVSRSGITISAMRARGVGRSKAVDFAFLMSMPAIAAAGAWDLLGALKGYEAIDWTATGLTVFFSCIFSLFAIRFIIAFAKKFSFAWFAAYRIALGAALLFFFV